MEDPSMLISGIDNSQFKGDMNPQKYFRFAKTYPS